MEPPMPAQDVSRSAGLSARHIDFVGAEFTLLAVSQEAPTAFAFGRLTAAESEVARCMPAAGVFRKPGVQPRHEAAAKDASNDTTMPQARRGRR
jgi:hypothetical protein